MISFIAIVWVHNIIDEKKNIKMYLVFKPSTISIDRYQSNIIYYHRCEIDQRLPSVLFHDTLLACETVH